eukprot:comp20547_c0_seq1/m.26373 comp20547_c0_seq1/g.26373  ORF comp20547_c0_seq1/g.26373 comp20547_c0_seq1/m.26373 type:complete len:317 (-) comp20547_c0_seq1:481-1431(-)
MNWPHALVRLVCALFVICICAHTGGAESDVPSQAEISETHETLATSSGTSVAEIVGLKEESQAETRGVTDQEEHGEGVEASVADVLGLTEENQVAARDTVGKERSGEAAQSTDVTSTAIEGETALPKEAGEEEKSGKVKVKVAEQLLYSNTSVVEMNATGLTAHLQETEPNGTYSALLIYARWCVFSSEFYPVYHAFARAYPNLPTLAMEFSDQAALRAWVSVSGLPTLVMFKGTTILNKYHGSRSLSSVSKWVTSHTGLVAVPDVEVTQEPFSVEGQGDHLLHLAMAALVVVVIVQAVMNAEGIHGLMTPHLKVE